MRDAKAVLSCDIVLGCSNEAFSESESWCVASRIWRGSLAPELSSRQRIAKIAARTAFSLLDIRTQSDRAKEFYTSSSCNYVRCDRPRRLYVVHQWSIDKTKKKTEYDQHQCQHNYSLSTPSDDELES